MPSPQISTYQVGLHLSTYSNHQRVSQQTNETIMIWAPSQTIRYYSFMLDIGTDILSTMHTYSGIDRPITIGPIHLVSLPTNINKYEKGSWNLLTNG